MTRPDLHTRHWRDLPRDGECVAEFLFGDAVGDCHGLMHRHHVRPRDPESRSYQACARHHPMIEAWLRRLTERHELKVKPCTHTHRYDHARRACAAARLAEAQALAGELASAA